MKTLIFQINVPFYSKHNPGQVEYGYNQEMYAFSEQYARDYASKHNSDYYVLTSPIDYTPAAGKHLDYQKLKIYDFESYDAILYLDSDYIIKKNAPNVFELFEDKFSAVINPGKKATTELASNIGIPRNSYFNAGFMYIPKNVILATKDKVDEYLQQEYAFQGQGLLNKLFFDSGIELNSLNEHDWNPVKATWGTYGDHYCGRKKKRWNNTLYLSE
jgi:lipopolysaccharide biosynthesis glycosyltransferase